MTALLFCCELMMLGAAIRTCVWLKTTSSYSRSCCSSKRCQAARPSGSVCESCRLFFNVCKLISFAGHCWPMRESRSHSRLAHSKGARLNAPPWPGNNAGSLCRRRVFQRGPAMLAKWLKARLSWPYGGLYLGRNHSCIGRFAGCR